MMFMVSFMVAQCAL